MIEDQVADIFLEGQEDKVPIIIDQQQEPPKIFPAENGQFEQQNLHMVSLSTTCRFKMHHHLAVPFNNYLCVRFCRRAERCH